MHKKVDVSQHTVDLVRRAAESVALDLAERDMGEVRRISLWEGGHLFHEKEEEVMRILINEDRFLSSAEITTASMGNLNNRSAFAALQRLITRQFVARKSPDVARFVITDLGRKRYALWQKIKRVVGIMLELENG